MQTSNVQRGLSAPILTLRICTLKYAGITNGVDVSMVNSATANTKMQMERSPQHAHIKTRMHNHSRATNDGERANAATRARIAGIGRLARHA